LSADLFGVGDLERWQEAGEFDEPGAVIVLLCEPCARRLIVPHPRLYRCLALFKPYPGAEKFCLDCRHRRELECGHPDLMRNGGKGLALTGPSPLLACVRPGGLKTIYPGPPTSCAGHDPATT
jgi:hypothetical protein